MALHPTKNNTPLKILNNHVNEPNPQIQKNLTRVALLVLHFLASPTIRYLLMFKSAWLVCIAILHIAADKI